MARALIFSDIHIHSHKERVDRLHDGIKVLDWVFLQAEKHNCDYILFLGDLFHERAKIDVLNYLRTFEVFMKHMIEKGTSREVFLLVGNHDMYHKERWDVNSIKPFTAIPGVNIIQSPLTMYLDGRKVSWLPHTENPLESLDMLRADQADVLLGHIAVHGAMTNTFYGTKSDVIVEYDNDMLPVDANVFSDWSLTVLGHYHGSQRLRDNVEYIGSPYQISYGEAFQTKHVMVLDLETLKREYVVNDFSPKHLIITPEDVEAENYDFNGNFVRVTVDDMSRKDLLDLQRKITTESKPLSVDIKSDDRKKEEDVVVLEGVRAALESIQDQLKVWVRERGVPEGLNEDHLLKAGMQCLEPKILS